MKSAETISVRSMDRKFLKGLGWTVGGKWSTQLVSWGSVIVLARLLTPADYGIVGMAGLYLLVTQVVAEFGLASAVMQMRELDRDALSQLHTVGVLTTMIGFLFCVVTSPAVAWFFQAEGLELVVAVNSLTVLMSGFRMVPFGILRRNLDYRRIAALEAIEAILRSVLIVLLAFLGWRYWAIVVGGLAARAIVTFLLNWWEPVPFGRPQWQVVKQPVLFGGQLSIGHLTTALTTQSDGIVVARLLGEALLGHYQMAMQLAEAPGQKISELVFRVTGPLFANLQDDRALLRRYYLNILEVLMLTVFPLTIGLAMVAPEAVRVLLGPQWDIAVEPVRWLTLYAALKALLSLTDQLLVSLRHTKLTMNLSIAMFLILPVSFFIGAQWGVGGVALCWLLTTPVVLVPYLRVVSRDLSIRFLDLGNVLLPSVVGCVVMAAGVTGCRIFIDPFNFHPAGVLSVLVSVGGLLYLGTVVGVFRSRWERYIRFARDLQRGRSRPPADPSPVARQA